MNTKIKAFAKIASEKITKIEAEINQSILNDAAAIDGILLEVFTNENPFQGETKNKVFFTYSNHYHGNSGTWMSVSSLNHAHTNYEDRGYIKGVATDLDGYMKLKSLLTVATIYNPLYLYQPKFRASKKSQEYVSQIANINSEFENKLKALAEKRVEEVNSALKSKTNLSLKFYIKNI